MRLMNVNKVTEGREPGTGNRKRGARNSERRRPAVASRTRNDGRENGMVHSSPRHRRGMAVAPSGDGRGTAGGASKTRRGGRYTSKRRCFNTSALTGRRNRRDVRTIFSPHPRPQPFAPPGRKRKKILDLLFLRFPRVPRRAAVRPRRSTRGYNPSPRRG